MARLADHDHAVHGFLARVALPHEECYPIGFVASPEMLPVRAHATMMPSTTGRHHETRNDARSSRGVGGCDSKPLFGSGRKGQAPDIARVHSGDGLPREVGTPHPEPSCRGP